MSNRDSFDDFDDDNQDDGFMTFDARDEVEDRSRGPLVIAAIVAVLLICGVILWRLYAGGRDAGETPQIAADDGSFKTAPADPGGTQTGDLDKGVFDAASGGAAPPVQVQPNTVGADDPLLADGSMATPTPSPATPAIATAPRPVVPAPTPAPAPRKEVAQAPAPKPVPKPAPVAQPKPQPAPQQVAAVAPAPKVVRETPAAAAVPVVATAAPAPAKAAPVAAPAPRATGGIAAQLGSFQTRASADVALSRYRASGLSGPVSVVAADLGPKGTWYRIRATGFDTRAEVDSFCAKARSAGAQCIPTGR